MNEEEFLNRLLNKIAKEFGYDAASTLKLIVMTKDKQVEQLNKEYERIYNENCKLRENHNINDITLLDENERLNNIIKELSKDVDMWNKKYNEQFNIITELGKWLEERTYGMNEIHTYKIGALEDEVILDKLKTLKENNK